MSKCPRTTLAVTIGDPGGIGPEIVIKCLGREEVLQVGRLILVGSAKIMDATARELGCEAGWEIWTPGQGSMPDAPVLLVDVPAYEDEVVSGKVCAANGLACWEYVQAAVRLVQEGFADALATAPITKESLRLGEVPYIDHTEMLSALDGGEAITLLANPVLRVVHVARHLSLRDSVEWLTLERIRDTTVETAQALTRSLGIDRPRVIVAGLNPHNGDGGMMGDEESWMITPAVEQARQAGVDVIGPVPGDTAFAKAIAEGYDFVVALYHDQGHIAIKASDWRRSIGLTIGLDLLRTSADHGSALDIAGRGVAHSDSMAAAICAAEELVQLRRRARQGAVSARRIAVADAALEDLDKKLGPDWQVLAIPGPQICRDHLRDAEALIVRSVTRVDAGLLEGTKVSFVGSATAGTDHVALDDLQRLGVRFAHSPGSNAQAVAEYVVTALLEMCVRSGGDLTGKTLGIIGVGQVGRRVATLTQALGLSVLLNDPPRAAAEGSAGFTELDELLAGSDIVTLHTPLTRERPWPSWHLLNSQRLDLMRPDAILVNSARGAVVDGRDLLAWLRVRPETRVFLDTWEGEPAPDARLIEAVTFGSAHVAGYSMVAKAQGIDMVVQALRDYFGMQAAPSAGAGAMPPVMIDAGSVSGVLLDDLVRICRQVVKIEAEDQFMRSLLDLPPQARGQAFNAYRADYAWRREFSECHVQGAVGPLRTALIALGLHSIG